MLGALLDRFRPDTLRSRVAASIKAGTGLSRQEWLFGPDPLEIEALRDLAEEITEWTRERIAASRRPYGIDQVALAVACAEPGGEPIASATFGVFRPVEFYTADGVASRLEDFVLRLPSQGLNDRRGPVRFAAALFSWGDVARETVFRDEDTPPPPLRGA